MAPHPLNTFATIQLRQRITTTYGPIFGGGNDLAVILSGTGPSFSNFPHCYTDTTGFKNTTFTGKKEFDVKEIEVYAIS